MFFRKGISLVTVLALMLSIFMVVPVSASPVTDDPSKLLFSKSARATVTPTIDGAMDEIYDNTAVLTPSRYSVGDQTKQTGSGTFRVLWDDGNLYIFADIIDTDNYQDNIYSWENDSIDIFIDESGSRNITYGPGVHQIRITADGLMPDEYCFKTGGSLTKEDIQYAAVATATGYAVEVKVPFVDYEPEENKTIGFEFQINDSTSDANGRVAAINWNDNKAMAPNNPYYFGMLQLISGTTTADDTILVDYPKDEALKSVDFTSKTVVPEGYEKLIAYESTAPLMNPDKGWVLYATTIEPIGSPNNMTEATLSKGNVGYFRFSWNEIQPNNANEYDWTAIDNAIAAWKAKGKKFAFGVMCANTAQAGTVDYISPKWLEDYGVEFRKCKTYFNLDENVADYQYIPNWNQAEYKQRLNIFVQALAEKYDGHPDVEWIDIRSYGNYGETHLWGLDVSQNPEENSVPLTIAGLREYVKMYTDAFKRTQLLLTRGDTMYNEVYSELADQGVGLRYDGFGGIRYPANDYFKKGSEREPMAVEFGLQSTDFTSDPQFEYNFIKGVALSGASYISMGQFNDDGQRFLAAAPGVIAKMQNILGYHFVLNDVIMPNTISAGESKNIILNWSNKGVAPIYKDAYPAIAILNSNNEVVEKYWLDGSNAKDWSARTVTEATSSVTFNSIDDGTYKLAVGLFSNKTDSTSYYGLGNKNKLSNGWYVITNNVNVADNVYTFNAIENVPVNVIVDGMETVYTDGEPYANGDEVLLPLQSTLEALKAKITIEGDSMSVVMGDKSLQYIVGSNGVIRSHEGVIFAPLSLLEQDLGTYYEFTWDKGGYSVSIETLSLEPIDKDNLIENPGFENGNTLPWDNWGQISATTENVRSGTYACKIYGTTANGGVVKVAVNPNESYSLSVWGNNINGKHGDGVVQYFYLDSSYNEIPGSRKSIGNFTEGSGYMQQTANFTTTPDTAYISIMVWGGANETYYIDDLSLKVNNDNLFSNPGFESGELSPWQNWGQLSISTENVHSGTYACKVYSTSANGGIVKIVAEPNQSYTLSVWGNNIDGIYGDSLLQYFYLNSSNEEIGSKHSLGNFTKGSGYMQQTVTFTTTPDTAYISIMVFGGANETYYIDDFSLIKNEKVEADLTAYNAAIAAVLEADYTAESWAAYQLVVNANLVTAANTQAEVDAATAAITTAQSDLVRNYTLSIGTESAGGAGYVRTINIGGTNTGELSGKNIVVQFTEGAGANAKVSVVMISPKSTSITISYQKQGTRVESWLTSGMPDLTSEEMGVTVYAHADTNQ